MRNMGTTGGMTQVSDGGLGVGSWEAWEAFSDPHSTPLPQVDLSPQRRVDMEGAHFSIEGTGVILV